ncbi:hypothetical protein EV138_6926 [Kribbella voronezhensis]|uniref:Uncharacterized protein n=1 Tax=Kribbella voronezhensis TaxID=2512212 RepID=A0A4R7SZF0_9ACTN|nr:hypothetical protein [Kribbella voronezhensis]TDU84455.1 hypothetical protein EV138_6926 [Kribbella voronezhensis]
MPFADEQERYDAVRVATVGKMRSGRPDLAGLAGEVLVRKLTEEALAEFYDDQIAANYAWDFVEREVRRAIDEA